VYAEDIRQVANRDPGTIYRSRTDRWVGIRYRNTASLDPVLSSPESLAEMLTISDDNPYQRLPEFALSKIGAYRDVYLSGDKASQLQALDGIDPSFVLTVATLERHELLSCTREQAIFYGVQHGLDLRSLTESNHWENIKEYIFCKLSIAPPQPVQQPRPSKGIIGTNGTNTLSVRNAEYVEAYQGYQPRIKSSKLGIELTKIAIHRPSVDVKTYLTLKQIANLRRYIQHDLKDDLSEDAILFLATRGYLLPEHIPDEQDLKRRRYINGCSESTCNLLKQLYNIKDVARDKVVKRLLRIDPHPIEEFILHLDVSGELEVASWLGIVVPPTSSRDYVRANILLYQELFQPREGRIECLSDWQIIERYQVYIDYTSRQHLIDGIKNLHTKERFFVSLDRKKCQNEETFYGTPTSNLDVPMVAYGTLDSYWCFEVEELKTTFGMTPGVFRSPDMVKEYTRQEIEQLRRVIRYYDGFAELVSVIDNGLVDLSQLDNVELVLRNAVLKWSSTKFHTMLWDLFMAGMYMRRWLGPGTPYPTREEDTKTQICPEERTTPMLVKIKEQIAENPKLMKSIRIRNLRQGQYQTGTERLPQFLDLVMTDQKCIRMASTECIGTACYYLDKFYGEKIPNFDSTTLDNIM